MKTSARGVDLIKSFEGLELEAYRDAVGIWTIGYGHTAAAGAPRPAAGLVISEEEATEILARDLSQYEAAIARTLKRVPTQNQFDAMVSLCYNIGEGAFAGSSVVRYFNAGDFETAAGRFLLWNKAKGRELKGLTRRREAERKLFLDGSTSIPPPPDIPAPVPRPDLLSLVINLLRAFFRRK